MITTRADRRRLKKTRQEHMNGKTISMLDCPRCPGYADAARKVIGTFPTWYPSSPPRIFLQCPACEIVWDSRG